MPESLGTPARTLPVAAASEADLIDVGQIGQMVARRWRTVVAGLVMGIAVAAAIVAWAPRRYDASASVVVRNSADAGASLLSRVGVPAELAPAALGNSLKSPLETEIQILGSRSVLGAVSDSLGLQVRVLAPRGVPPWRLVRPVRLRAAFTKIRLTFARTGGGWRVRGRGVDATVVAGQTIVTPVGTLAVAGEAPAQDFEIEVSDREQALKRHAERLQVGKPGGEVVDITYHASDSLSAAAVPNAIVSVYLKRRRTTDRGTNEHRAEFLVAQLDSTSRQLTAAERALRAYQESNDVFDPALTVRIDLEAMTKVGELLAANEVEGRALEALLRDVDAGRASSRQLAAYPSFLRSPAINEILTQITRLETERTQLLERRTPEDPEVIALSVSIADLDRQLRPLGVAYAGSLARQHASLATQAARFDSALAVMPASTQAFARLQRDVGRLSQAALALQAQLMEVRLAAVGEGGDVRPLDEAAPPDRVAFPRPLPTLAVGAAGGLALGLALALFGGFFSHRIDGAADAERATGLPAARIGRPDARFFAALRPIDGLVVVPVDDRAPAAAAAAWLHGTNAARPTTIPRAAVAAGVAGDGPAGGARSSNGVDGHRAGAPPAVLPPLTGIDALVALEPAQRAVLVVRRGATRRSLADATEALELAGAAPVGVVVT